MRLDPLFLLSSVQGTSQKNAHLAGTRTPVRLPEVSWIVDKTYSTGFIEVTQKSTETPVPAVKDERPESLNSISSSF